MQGSAPRDLGNYSLNVGDHSTVLGTMSTVLGTMNREAHKSRQRKSATSQPAAGSHGSLFLSTSLNFRTVNILSLRARGELWRRSKLAQIR